METKCCTSYGSTMSQMMEKRINQSKKKGSGAKINLGFHPGVNSLFHYLWKKKVVTHETVDNNCKTF